MRGEASELRLGQVAAVAAGNALEFYDFLAYAFFAVQIGRSFFPSSDPGSSLLATFATFGAGFLMRPVGALIIGRLGDRIGRKPAMTLSFALMGVAMAGMALTPPRSAIGLAAPALAVFWRLVQGFALGGDVGPSTAFLAEAAPPERRGLYISLQFTGQYFSNFAAGAVGAILAWLLPEAQLDAWGWRVAFGLGAAAIPLALAVRRRLTETFDARTVSSEDRPDPPTRPRLLVLGFLMLAGGTTVTYVMVYLTTFVSTTLHLPATTAFLATAIFGLCGTVCGPLGGWLSDKAGRKAVMTPPAVVLLLVALPAFGLIVKGRNAEILLAGDVVLSVCATTAFTVIMCAITESLPRRTRSGALGLVYALAISVFGGSTPFVVAWLGRLTGSAFAPAWYMTGGIAVCVAAMLMFPETRPTRAPQA